MSNNNELNLLKELVSLVESKGFARTLNILKENNNKGYEVNDPFDSFVLNTISTQFDISIENIMRSRYVRGDMKYAIGFCVYYMYENKSLGEIKKNVFKDRNKGLLFRYRQMIIELTKKDSPYFEIKTELDKIIQTYKKNNK